MMLPVGYADNYKMTTVKPGDKLKLVTGETVVFEKMNRTRFVARYNKKGLRVPTWRDRFGTTPFITEVVGHDSSVVPKVVAPTDLEPGNIFVLMDKPNKVYMFRKETAGHIHGYDIATKRSWRIPKSTEVVKISLSSIYKELIEQ